MLVAVVLPIHEPITPHFKAVHLFNIKNTMKATRPHPEELLYHIEGRDNAVVPNLSKTTLLIIANSLQIVLCEPGAAGHSLATNSSNNMNLITNRFGENTR